MLTVSKVDHCVTFCETLSRRFIITKGKRFPWESRKMYSLTMLSSPSRIFPPFELLFFFVSLFFLSLSLSLFRFNYTFPFPLCCPLCSKCTRDSADNYLLHRETTFVNEASLERSVFIKSLNFIELSISVFHRSPLIRGEPGPGYTLPYVDPCRSYCDARTRY